MVSEALAGVFRSLRTYHGGAAPKAKMDALYAGFLQPGDLAFDIGAHVGDRISSFRRLGARCLALEPQPRLMRALRLIHGRDRHVVILPYAAAAAAGARRLHLNTHNPTVSTLAEEFVTNADGAAGWEGQSWDGECHVACVTLDQLIATFGMPAFIKIDVEGFEDEVLRGLTTPVPALSFEFTTIARTVAQHALDRLEDLAPYRFNFALGESQTLTFPDWLAAGAMRDYLRNLPHAANSGDVYACLRENAKT